MKPALPTCPRCGRPVDADSPRGLCAHCLIQACLTPLQEPLISPMRSDLSDPSAPSDPSDLQPRLPGASPFDLAERSFGDYELLEEIQRGGMGVVYRAHQRSAHRLVALKMLAPNLLATPTEVQRFHLEAEAAASLDHPNILPVYDVGEHQGQPFYTMKLVEGGTLAHWATQHRPASSPAPTGLAETVRLFLKVARAVAYAHQHGVLHRDLKPANILVDDQGEPYVADFGLAKFLDRDTGLTRSLTVLGTPAYAPPEQLLEGTRALTTAADVYSLGAVLYELLTGHPPFERATTLAILRDVAERQVKPPRLINPRIHRDLETICLKCLEKEPARRFASAVELTAELERYLEGRPIASRPVSSAERLWRWARRNPVTAGLSGASAVLLLTVLIGSPIALFHIDRERDRAAASAAEQQQENYFSSILLAQHFIEQGSIAQAKDLLFQCPEEYRHWEWGHLMLLCHQAMVTLRCGSNQIVHLEFTRRDDRLLAVNAAGVLKVWHWPNRTELFVRSGTSNPVQVARFSPDGRWLAIGTGQGELELWNTDSTKKPSTAPDTSSRPSPLPLGEGGPEDRVRAAPRPPGEGASATAEAGEGAAGGSGPWQLHLCIPGHGTAVKALAWSPQGDHLATGAGDGSVSLHWPFQENRPLRLAAHKQAVTHASFTADGRRLITRSPEAVAVWDTANGEALDHFEVSTRSGTTIFTDGQGQHRAIIDDQSQVFLLGNDRPDRRLGRITGAQFGRVRQLFFSPQDRWLASAGEEHTARIWNLETTEEHLAFPDRVHRVVFSADGRLAAVLDATTSATIWEVGQRRLLKTLRGHDLPMESAAFDNRGRVVATGDSQGWVKLWTAQPGRQRFQEQTWVWGVSYSPDGRYLAMSPAQRGVWVLDAHSGQVRWIVKASVEAVTATAFSPLDSHLLVTGGSHYVARLFDLRTGRKLRTLLGHEDMIWDVEFSPDGKLLATASADGSVRLWEVDSGRLRRLIESDLQGLYCVNFSPDGTRLVAGGDGPSAGIWDVASGRLLRELVTCNPFVSSVRFAGEGDSAITVGWEGDVQVWNVTTGTERLRWKLRALGYFGEVTRDGRRLLASTHAIPAYGYDFATVDLWDIASGRRVLELDGPTDLVSCLAYNPATGRIGAGCLGLSCWQWESLPWRDVAYAALPDGALRERVATEAEIYWTDRFQAEASEDPAGPELSRTIQVGWEPELLPSRPATATPQQLDLSAHFTSPLTVQFYPSDNGDIMADCLPDLPVGLHELNGIEFDLRGVVQLRKSTGDLKGPWIHLWAEVPLAARVTSTPPCFINLHLLHGVVGQEQDGVTVAELTLHYADGVQASLPLIYGRDVSNWEAPIGVTPSLGVNTKIAYTGSNRWASKEGLIADFAAYRHKRADTVRHLYHTTLVNPHPDHEVLSLDYTSAMARCAPFLIAITVD